MLLLLVWLSLSLAYVWQTMVEISDDSSSLLSLLPIRIESSARDHLAIFAAKMRGWREHAAALL